MPGMDRTGPMGYGPRTGRGKGYCGRGLRRGFGAGLLRGRGYGRGYGFVSAGFSKDEEKKILEQELEELELEKKEIETRIRELI